MCAAVLAQHALTALSWTSTHPRTGLWGALALDRSVAHRVASGGQYWPLVAQGEVWRLWTCVFVHADGLHLLLNALALWGLGRLLEPTLGARRWLAWFLFSGVCGATLAHLAGHLQSDGASGGAFGLLGAAVALGVRHRAVLPAEDARLLIRVCGGFLLANLVLTFALPFLDAAGHIGGMLAGFALGGTWPIDERTRHVERAWIAISLCFLGYGAWRVLL